MRLLPLTFLLGLAAGSASAAGPPEALLDGSAAAEVVPPPPPAVRPSGGMLLGFEAEARRVGEADEFELAVCAVAPCGRPRAVSVQRIAFFPMLVQGERVGLAIDVPAALVGKPLFFALAPVKPGAPVAASLVLRDFAWMP